MVAHQFVAELVLRRGSRTEREEGGATRRSGPRGVSKEDDGPLAIAPAINAIVISR
jgi:hypothetical protein